MWGMPVGLGANLTLNILLDCTLKFSYTQYMYTLSKASKDTKEILKWGGLFIAGLVMLVLVVRIVIFIKELVFPTPPPKPTVAFGKIPPQAFGQNATGKALNYFVDTLTGTLPSLPDQTKIYRMQPVRPDILAINKFEEKVTSVGFSKGSTPIADKIFEWKSNPNQIGIDRRIRVNIVNNSFTITSAYMSDPNVLAGKNLPSQPAAINIAERMLESMEMLPEDVDLSKTKTNLFSIRNNSLVTSTSLSNSQIVEVDFIQKDVNKLPIYYQNPNASSMSILIAGGETQPQIVGANYVYQPISDQSSTYPLKSTDE